MSWHCSRALVAAYSEATCLVGDLSALSSTTPTPDQFYWPDKTTEHSRLSRFGMTCEPLTADHGAELLTWYLEGFPAKTSALQEEATAWTASAPGCGRKWLESLGKYDPDSRTWKTPQLLLDGGSEEFLGTWPRWGSMRTGESWERTTPQLRTCATEFGLWPTPCATDCSDRKPSATMHETRRGTFKHRAHNGTLSQVRLSQVVRHRSPGMDGLMSPDWVEWLMGWPTGHTELKPLATAKFREWQQQHSIS